VEVALSKPDISINYQPRWVTNKINEYRQIIFHSLAANIDQIRVRAAEKYIIPNTTGIRNPYYASKKQPSHPSKLTERTGNLIRMLKHKTKTNHWNFGTATTKNRVKSATLRTNAFRGRIKVDGGFRSAHESYIAELKVDIDEAALLDSRVSRSRRFHTINRMVHTQNGPDIQQTKTKITKRETKQTLAMRFKHETGIRGTKRPFLRPAAEDQHFYTQNLIARKLKDLGRYV